jgi:hypothetical protein
LTWCWEECVEAAVACATLVSICQITRHHILDMCVLVWNCKSKSKDLKKGRNNEDLYVVAMIFVWKTSVPVSAVKNIVVLKWYTDDCKCFLSVDELDKIGSLPYKNIFEINVLVTLVQ